MVKMDTRSRRKKGDTKQRILDAAEKLLLENGLDATSTTDIANEAGCNHALIHYYYGSKANLVRKVFNKKFLTMRRVMESTVLSNDEGFFALLRNYLDVIFDILEKSPNLANFVLKETVLNRIRSRHFLRLIALNEERTLIYARFCARVNEAIEKGEIRRVNPADLVMDIISLSLMSFVTLPLFVQDANEEPDAAHAVLEGRKTDIYEMLVRGLQPVK